MEDEITDRREILSDEQDENNENNDDIQSKDPMDFVVEETEKNQKNQKNENILAELENSQQNINISNHFIEIQDITQQDITKEIQQPEKKESNPSPPSHEQANNIIEENQYPNLSVNFNIVSEENNNNNQINNNQINNNQIIQNMLKNSDFNDPNLSEVQSMAPSDKKKLDQEKFKEKISPDFKNDINNNQQNNQNNQITNNEDNQIIEEIENKNDNNNFGQLKQIQNPEEANKKSGETNPLDISDASNIIQMNNVYINKDMQLTNNNPNQNNINNESINIKYNNENNNMNNNIENIIISNEQNKDMNNNNNNMNNQITNEHIMDIDKKFNNLNINDESQQIMK